MPNGLSEAPRKFTKLMKVVFSTLRKLGHTVIAYIDDSLLLGDTYDDCATNIKDTVLLLDSLGFTIHPDKSILTPTQSIVFLGFLIDSVTMSVRLALDKCHRLQDMCRSMLNCHSTSIRELSQLVGHFVAAEPGVLYARLFYKRIELARNAALKLNKGNWDANMLLSSDIREDLQWWIDNLPSASKSILTCNPDLVITSDSSGLGWGCACAGNSTGGLWSQQESGEHINYKELLAAFLALKVFGKHKVNVHICLHLDNTTAVAYVTNMGGHIPQFNTLTREIWLWALQRNIWLTAKHLPGKLNILADAESRKQHNSELEWSLHKDVFDQIESTFARGLAGTKFRSPGTSK